MSILILLVILLSIISINYVYAQTSSVNIKPSIVQLNIGDNQLKQIPPYALQFTSNRTLTNITVHFSDLRSDEDNKLWISRNIMSLSPTTFNVAPNQLGEADILFNLQNQTAGKYNGTMTLTSSNGILGVIPIKININHNSPIISLVLVAVGLVTAFMIKFVKMRINIRDAALESLDKAVNAAWSASGERRFDMKYERADKEFLTAQASLLKGDYRQARKSYDISAEFYNAARTGEDSEEDHYTQRQLIPYGKISAMAERAKANKGLHLSFTHSDNILFLIGSVVFATVIMQTWTKVYSQLISLNNTDLWYIGAFLLGYGSQSLIGEIVELSKR